jgi:hypothetical protein
MATTQAIALEKGPFCQSCGMPMMRADDFARGVDGYRINDYCTFCYDAGGFTEPSLTMRQMIEKCVPFMVRGGMPEPQARGLVESVLPRLRRWQQPRL